MVRTAGNTSPWEDSTMLTSIERFNARITYESLLVPDGSRSQPQNRPLQSLVTNWQQSSKPWTPSILPSLQLCHIRERYEVLKQGITSSGRVYNFDEFQKLEEPEEEFLKILQAYQTTTKSRSAKGTLPKGREHCCSASCKGAKENANTTSRSAGLHTLYSFGANGRADELSVNPRGYMHQQLPSTCPWQRRFKTRRKSSNNVQKTLRVAHPRGCREQPGC
ncbi:hypothetical protein F2Q69_00022567 [Brassica cretica]|uniref:Uncharacterized protein n=1 Tax=Brassica cretica TaxID=69181 RepID=A0A8S9QQ12_BRACR|nr:hypothetical protein F2Q69_00022567 [Brassica cretica]